MAAAQAFPPKAETLAQAEFTSAEQVKSQGSQTDAHLFGIGIAMRDDICRFIAIQ